MKRADREIVIESGKEIDNVYLCVCDCVSFFFFFFFWGGAQGKRERERERERGNGYILPLRRISLVLSPSLQFPLCAIHFARLHINLYYELSLCFPAIARSFSPFL